MLTWYRVVTRNQSCPNNFELEVIKLEILTLIFFKYINDKSQRASDREVGPKLLTIKNPKGGEGGSYNAQSIHIPIRVKL